MNTRLSRRKFLKVASITISAASLSAVGAGCSTQSSLNSGTAKTEIETPSFTYGDEQAMNPRILVTYATRTGSSIGVASAIGETLAERGFTVDVKPMSENPSLEAYQGFVLGSAINGGNWLPEAVKYVSDHQADLNRAPVALFCVHIMNLGNDQSSTKRRLAYLDAVRSLVNPVSEAFFAGLGMNSEDESAIVRWVYRTFKIGPEGDCRDWSKIRGWAQSVLQ